MNYKQLYAIKRDAELRIQKHNSDITHDSGIYIYERTVNFIYIGQARDLMARSISHLTGYDQHIDLSLKKFGLKSETNPSGWELNILEHCDIDELDLAEKFWIVKYQTNPQNELYNVTSGGQGQGKEDIGQRKPTKTYKDGVSYGRDKVIKEIQERLTKGDIKFFIDKPNKIKQHHLDKLVELLEVKDEINNAD